MTAQKWDSGQIATPLSSAKQSKNRAKLEKYEKHPATPSRNSYSKTDPAATFMSQRDDYMQNG
ncbi:MAG: hypothetical protein LBP85_10555 [Prevotellaceae bacterium]|nr:hypothetical protein [Prevotellaceae bacterium]